MSGVIVTPPCPKCGSGETGYMHHWFRHGNSDEWRIRCSRCGHQTEAEATFEAALAKWAGVSGCQEGN